MPSPPPLQRFGSHLSIAGGLENAFADADRLGCDCLQIFVKNQRRWTAKPLTNKQIQAFRSAATSSSVAPVVAHASYLINLASPDSTLLQKSVDAMIDELTRCEALGIEALIVHPGAHMGAGVDAGIARVAQSLDEIHKATSGIQSRIALECTAGQGTCLGHELSQLGRMIQSAREPDRLRVCLDTCHLFAAGYDLRDESDYQRMSREIEESFGHEAVCCLHVNDSVGDVGCRRDRHEHITKGKIGRAGFLRILNDTRLLHAPRILETEKGVDVRGVDLDRINLRRLRGLAGKSR